jgi:Tol biopolymer transport system component
VAALPAARTARITTVPVMDPAWSPDGRRIAFVLDRSPGGIATIRPDGTELKTVIVHNAAEWSSVTRPLWSPTGGHLAYRQVSFRKPVEFAADFDVFLAAADGDRPVNLTADVDTFLTPVAWR